MAGAFGALWIPGGPPGAFGADAGGRVLGSAASAGRSASHFLHFDSSGALKAPQEGHFFIMSLKDGGLKHIFGCSSRVKQNEDITCLYDWQFIIEKRRILII